MNNTERVAIAVARRFPNMCISRAQVVTASWLEFPAIFGLATFETRYPDSDHVWRELQKLEEARWIESNGEQVRLTTLGAEHVQSLEKKSREAAL